MIRPLHSPKQLCLAKQMRTSLLDPRVKANLSVSGENFRRMTGLTESTFPAAQPSVRVQELYPTLFHLIADLQNRSGSGSGFAICAGVSYCYTYDSDSYKIIPDNSR